MHGKARTTRNTRTFLRRRPDAITWIDRRRALVARTTPGGTIELDEFELPADAAGRMLGLVAVARAIGDRERIVVMGDEPIRTSLEREYVAIYHRPDRLVDVEREGPVGRADLLALLRELSG